jgi:hypothetical protein
MELHQTYQRTLTASWPTVQTQAFRTQAKLTHPMPQAPPEEFMAPPFPSMTGNPARKTNKLTMATGRIMEAIQVKQLMSKAEMMALGQCGEERVSEIASGLIWANIQAKERKNIEIAGRRQISRSSWMNSPACINHCWKREKINRRSWAS